MTLSKMDYWRLADELSVVDAAILITGNDPSERVEVTGEDGGFIFDDRGVPRTFQRTHYDGFDAAFKALRNAIFSNRLPANIGLLARDEAEISENFYAHGERTYVRREVDADDNEIRLEFDTLLRASEYSLNIFSNREIRTLHNATILYVLKEPSWHNTMIKVVDLTKWLASKGLKPVFFFPQGKAEGFRDKNHPRYSAKLACAVAAWEAVKAPKRNKSVKATIEEWVQSNAVSFGMIGSDGVPSSKSVGEASVVANWDTRGGAVKTQGPADVEASDDSDGEAEEIQNFDVVYATSEDIPF